MAKERIEVRHTRFGPSVFNITGNTAVVSKVWDALSTYKDMYYIRLKYDRKLRQYVRIDSNYPPIKTLNLD